MGLKHHPRLSAGAVGCERGASAKGVGGCVHCGIAECRERRSDTHTNAPTTRSAARAARMATLVRLMMAIAWCQGGESERGERRVAGVEWVRREVEVYVVCACEWGMASDVLRLL